MRGALACHPNLPLCHAERSEASVCDLRTTDPSLTLWMTIMVHWMTASGPVLQSGY